MRKVSILAAPVDSPRVRWPASHTSAAVDSMRRIITKPHYAMTTGASHRSITAARDERRLRPGHFWLVRVLFTTVVALHAAGIEVQELLKYQRSAVERGEWWRLVTGHLVHGNFQHMALNLAGAGLVAVLFGRDYSAANWWFILLASALSIAVGFVFCEPQLQWYVGLSGVLHGAIAAGIVAWWHYENRRLTLIAAVLLVLKLGWEQSHGALPLSGDMPVIVDAHLYGSIGGAVAALILAIRRRHWPRGATSL